VAGPRGARRAEGGGVMRRRLALAALLAALVAVAAAGAAAAHPLGNFTINRLDVVSVSQDRVDVRWILDQAEIPTFRERGLASRTVLERKARDAAQGLHVEVDGQVIALRQAGPGAIAFPAGQGGLKTTRVVLDFTGALPDQVHHLDVRDDGERGRIGWRSIVVVPGHGTAVRSSVPSQDVTGGLRRYPKDLLSDPADARSARLTVAPGRGTVVAPRARGAGLETTGDRGADGGFARLLSDAAAGRGVLLLLLLAAAGWGALHALSPGHGKSMVAAYLVGTRGTARDAVALGATVTVTHTIGVFALGGVALGLSQWIVPEDLYPWLTLTSGVMVLAVGAGVLRNRFRRAAEHHPAHAHGHGHSHDHLPRRSLLALGASAGLVPCPSALVVLLAAVAQHEIALGLLLIVAFSLGLATTLTTLGLLVVRASRLLQRAAPGRVLAVYAPAASAVAIVVVGLVLTLHAAQQVVA
ncbi:MAG TPA: sulfite exporter TauE/SafE family protein, partial [Baekduia sp.]|nr:sulfite exporter TauE/SafE family protein [Baekduia sp.]